MFILIISQPFNSKFKSVEPTLRDWTLQLLMKISYYINYRHFQMVVQLRIKVRRILRFEFFIFGPVIIAIVARK